MTLRPRDATRTAFIPVNNDSASHRVTAGPLRLSKPFRRKRLIPI